MLHDVPLFPKLLLDVHDHIVSIPLAAVLHILNQRVADLTDFNPRQNLRNLRLFNSISPLLKIFQRLRQSLLLELGVRQLGVSYSDLLLRGLVLVIDLRDGGLGFHQQALQLLLVADQLFDFQLTRLQSLFNLHQVDVVEDDRLAKFAKTQLLGRL